MSKWQVSPMRIIDIREYAMRIRGILGYKDTDFIHAPKLFDRLAILFADQGLEFDYKILPDNDGIFANKEEAYTDLLTGTIYIKESVMEEACRRSFKRGTFTLIHELGHFLLHYLQSEAKLTRVPDDTVVPVFCNPEWQADTFASEFLMPYEACLFLTIEEIRKQYHVSRQAAEVRFNKINGNESKALSIQNYFIID